MRTRFAIKTHALMERYFPERRLFLRSDTDTRFIRLKSETQLLACVGGALVLSWTIVATAILLMDSIGAGNFREQAKRDQMTYQMRLNDLSRERDARAAEAQSAQERFNTALTQVSLSIPVVAGRMALGTWQGIYLWEHRHAGYHRKVTVHVMGE